jgi:hypothetical protein
MAYAASAAMNFRPPPQNQPNPYQQPSNPYPQQPPMSQPPPQTYPMQSNYSNQPPSGGPSSYPASNQVCYGWNTLKIGFSIIFLLFFFRTK